MHEKSLHVLCFPIRIVKLEINSFSSSLTPNSYSCCVDKLFFTCTATSVRTYRSCTFTVTRKVLIRKRLLGGGLVWLALASAHKIEKSIFIFSGCTLLRAEAGFFCTKRYKKIDWKILGQSRLYMKVIHYGWRYSTAVEATAAGGIAHHVGQLEKS